MSEMTEKDLKDINMPIPVRPVRPRRSVLYVPANNERALQKSLQLPCDAVIYDLEDAVLPEHKDVARETLRRFFLKNFPDGISQNSKERLIRINSMSSPWGQEDLLAACAIMPSAIVIPKVSRWTRRLTFVFGP